MGFWLDAWHTQHKEYRDIYSRALQCLKNKVTHLLSDRDLLTFEDENRCTFKFVVEEINKTSSDIWLEIEENIVIVGSLN